MSGSTIETLRQTLLARYGDLMKRLTRRLGSPQVAEEALQDTWLKLQRTTDVGVVRNEDGYLIRTAINLAIDRKRSEHHLASVEDIEEALEFADEAPNPEQVAQGRSEMRALERAITELPVRRRQIFLAAWREGVAHTEIAARHGLSVRMIDMELANAREFCATYMKKENNLFRTSRKDTSNE